MAALGALGSSWQYGAGPGALGRELPRHSEAFKPPLQPPPLPPPAYPPSDLYGTGHVQAFGSDASAWSFARDGRAPLGHLGGNGSLGGIGSFVADAGCSPMEEEVPRIFSAKALSTWSGDIAQGPYGIPSGMGGRGGFRGLGSGSETSVGMGGSLPSGDPCWVTVFGFPGRSAALIRQQLESRCGPVVEARHGDGNFMHLRFQSATAASQCLAHNGRPLLGGVLVGCVPCTAGLPSTVVGNGEEAELPFGFDGSIANGGAGFGIAAGGFGITAGAPIAARWPQTANSPSELPWRSGSLDNQVRRAEGPLHRLLALLFDM